jgi:hypothetical protein
MTTYTYTASTNTLKEVPTMERPVAPNPELYGGDSRALSQDVHDFMIEKEEYNAHLASLKEIPCEPACKEVWKDGDAVIEGKDFKLTFEACADHHLLAEMYHCQDCKLIAYPIKAESEDEYETWREMFTLFVNRFVVAENATANIGDAIKVFRKEYFISKIK